MSEDLNLPNCFTMLFTKEQAKEILEVFDYYIEKNPENEHARMTARYFDDCVKIVSNEWKKHGRDES